MEIDLKGIVSDKFYNILKSYPIYFENRVNIIDKNYKDITKLSLDSEKKIFADLLFKHAIGALNIRRTCFVDKKKLKHFDKFKEEYRKEILCSIMAALPLVWAQFDCWKSDNPYFMIL